MRWLPVVCLIWCAGTACSDAADGDKGAGAAGTAGAAGAAGTHGSSAGAGTGEDAGSSAGAGTGTGGTHEVAAAGTGGDGGGADACSPEALREPSAGVTYYVAIDEPGADNEACDGLAPSDEGGGHCPFRDFDSERTSKLLDGVASTRVEVRAGHYTVHGWDGLRVTGIGASDEQRVILSAYPGEQPVLDVPRPDGEGCTEQSAMDDPSCVRQVLRVSGQYTVVQGLTIQNGLGYHLEVTGGAHHLLRCNTLGETVAFPMRSDCMKLDGGARDIEVSHNDFSRFRSQAIDMTDVSEVLIEDNEFHDPIDADAGATGTKHGAADITIRGNRVYDMGSDTKMHAFSLGGTGTEHPHDHTAYRLRLEANQVSGLAGILAQLVSCQDCEVVDNVVRGAGAGILLSASATGMALCGSAADGCGPNSGTRIAGNRLRDFDGGGDAAQANVFVVVELGEGAGLEAEGNVYCAPSATDARFGVEGELIGFEAWKAAVGSDDGSRALASSDADCAF